MNRDESIQKKIEICIRKGIREVDCSRTVNSRKRLVQEYLDKYKETWILFLVIMIISAVIYLMLYLWSVKVSVLVKIVFLKMLEV